MYIQHPLVSYLVDVYYLFIANIVGFFRSQFYFLQQSFDPFDPQFEAPFLKEEQRHSRLPVLGQSLLCHTQPLLQFRQ